VAGAAGFGVLFLKTIAAPGIDAVATARPLWRQVAPHHEEVCLADIKRDWDYGLAYYAGFRLPQCEDHRSAWEVVPVLPDGAALRPADVPKP
jgi:hypothetical protein